jgi:hypothetical protein
MCFPRKNKRCAKTSYFHELIPSDDDSQSEPEAEESKQSRQKQKLKRRLRNKALIATMVSYGILFARSKNNNYIQVCLSIASYQICGPG